MSLIRINKNPSGRQLAVFGAAWLVFLGAAGLAVRLRGGHGAGLLWAAAAAVPLAGAVWPRGLRHLYLGLSYATYPIGFVVSHVALLFMYTLVLTPVGLAMRLFRHDPLSRKFDREAGSYWMPRDRARKPESYLNQN